MDNGKSKAACLICNETCAVFKKYNMKRHFLAKHKNFGQQFSTQELKVKAADMVIKLKQQQRTLIKFSSTQEAATKASFVLAHKIAKSNKPFSDAEFVKDCMVDAINIVCPEVKSKIDAIPMSRTTTVRRIEAIAANLQENLLNTANTFKCFSIALDESTDVLDTAQLMIFIRGIDKHFCITEELLSMESLKGTTTGHDLFNSVMHSLETSQLCLDKLVSITTDGAPSLTGKHTGLIKRINDKITADYPLHKVLSFHCIIHQGSLCKSRSDFKHVVKPVVQAVNVIRSKGLNHRQFRDFLQDIDSDFSDVLYLTNVRWLSLGIVLKRVWELKEEIVVFFEMKDIVCDFSTKARDTEWMSDFAFATDIIYAKNE
ncbi:general transcription factor II-I repeat domain-containing protein 2-like [Styela clava]